MTSRPSTANGAGPSSVPLIKSFRFSSSHDVHSAPLASGGTPTASKRSSKLQEYLGRSRTASLPPRPHTSGGLPGHKRFTLTGKTKEVADDESQGSVASSSIASAADPFAAHPSTSASFVPYSSNVATSHSPPSTSHNHSSYPQAVSPPSPSSPQFPSPNGKSQAASSPSTLTGSNTAQSRRRGSILHAASDAFSRMNPIRTRTISKQPTASVRVTSPTPIVLTEVIEITESAVLASKRREAEEEERERLRDAAAKALGIGDVEAEVSSFQSYSHLEDDYEIVYGGFNGEEFGLRDGEPANEETPVATSPVTGLPVVNGTGTISSHSSRPTHARSRSGSILPLTLNSLQRPATPKAPSVISQATPATVSSVPPITSVAPKSHSTPPALTLSSLHRPPPLTVSTLSPPRLGRSPSTRTATSGSTMPMSVHSRTYAHERALPPPKTPPFPTTPALLTPFKQLAVTIPRYYPASSLLMYALAKQWKTRYFVLTSPMPTPVSSPPHSPTTTTPTGGHLAPSYLHMFKSSGTGEREIERLEIDEESMAYMADGEVGGRRFVVKFEGVLRKRAAHHAAPHSGTFTVPMEDGPAGGEEGRTTWIVQIADVEETQKWIEAIKSAVLNQRTIRAGLSASSSGATEPRGDLDVVLSMRAQGFSTTPISPLQTIESLHSNNGTVRAQGSLSPTHSHFTGDGSRSSPTSSLSRSQGAALSAALTSFSMNGSPNVSSSNVETSSLSSPTRASMSATTALKSLFAIGGGARPRSPSTASLAMHAASPTFSDEIEEEERIEGDSFSRAGNSLLNMMRNSSFSSDRPLSPTTSVPPTPRVGTPAEQFLDRKILPDSDRHLVETEGAPEALLRTNSSGLGLTVSPPRDRDGHIFVPSRVSSDMGSQSLQPPPRKRAGTVNSITASASTSTEHSGSYAYAHTNGSTAESLGVNFNANHLTPSPPMPTTGSPSSSRPKDRRARASWSSVSSWASHDHPPSSPDDARARRWSRRSSHPYRMSPPYGPPPATPPSSPQSPTLRGMRTPPVRHPYAADESLSRSSSVGSSPSPEIVSRPLSSKRTSGGSLQSFSTASTSQSRTTGLGGISIFSHGPRPRSSHRASMPPPPRPAPNVALPPTPAEGGSAPGSPLAHTHSAPVPRNSFRDSFGLRSQRFTLSSPINTAMGLPSRTDESGRRPSASMHRRSSSHGSTNGTTSTLYPIPASPTRTKSPFPPPSGPLPPTPPSLATGSPAQPTRSPRTSLKRRLNLKRLSSPSSPPPQTAPPMPPVDGVAPMTPSLLLPSPDIVEPSPIIPPTPIGEPITMLQNDPDFLSQGSPTPPHTPLPDTPVLAPEGFAPLPPPPRRASRQVSSQEKTDLNQELLPSSSVVLLVTDEGDNGEAPAPPPEVDDFVSLLTLTPRSPDHSAVSFVDVSI